MHDLHENGDTNIYTEIHSVCVRLATQCKKEKKLFFYPQTNNNKNSASALVKYIVITKMSASSRI